MSGAGAGRPGPPPPRNEAEAFPPGGLETRFALSPDRSDLRGRCTGGHSTTSETPRHGIDRSMEILF